MMWIQSRLFPALVLFLAISTGVGASQAPAADSVYVASVLTAEGGFTGGIEGPAVDAAGNLYAVNFGAQHTIGVVTPDGAAELFVTLPEGSTGNGIRFNRAGHMLIADYTGHNVLRVDMVTKKIDVFAHEAEMNQPNDLAIGADDALYASDPDWRGSSGQIWRISPAGQVKLLETDMGTTNGIEVSPDETSLYVGESVQKRIWVYDLSATGEVSNKRLLIQFEDGGMDGIRCDVEGNLYVTRHGSSVVAKVSPAGQVLRLIQLAGKNPSNIAFGGPDGRTAYVTLQDKGNIETFRVEAPGRAWQLLPADR